MTSGAALQEEYCQCLERDFRRGRTGVCTDAALQERLYQHLLDDPELHRALCGEDTFAVLATALQGQLDLRGALRNLGKAFEVLELAALNLYFSPWRKEFGTIKMFSGIYVHVLQGVLPDADLARFFHRLGYVQKDKLHLVISQLPPGANLLAAACGFFAARVECEILGKIVEGLEPYMASPGELLQARKEARGSLDGCVAKLQSLVCWPRSREFHLDQAEGIDLYQESPEGHGPYDEPMGARPQNQHPLALSEHGSSSTRLWSREPRPQGLTESRSKVWTVEQPYDNGIPGPEASDLETSFSFISLRRELSRTSETDYSLQPGSWLLSPSPNYDGPQAPRAASPLAPSPKPLRSPQLSPSPSRRALGPGAGAPLGEPPRYRLHSCMRPGALPSSCCSTCRLLHGGGCSEASLCRSSSSHRLEELQSEKQQRLWLQRTEVEKLLYEGAGAWQ